MAETIVDAAFTIILTLVTAAKGLCMAYPNVTIITAAVVVFCWLARRE